MTNIILIGASDHAKEIMDIIHAQNKYHIIGLIDLPGTAGNKVMGYPVLGTEELIPDLVRQHENLQGVIAVGNNWRRYEIYQKVNQIIPGFTFATIIHPSAIVAEHVTIGEGAVIMPGVIINNEAQIGNFCLLNTKSSLDHNSVMGDFSSLAPGVTIGGNATIGDYSAISLGANVIHEISIGAHTVIGAGSTVVRSIPEKVVAYGCPAKIIRTRQIGEKYL